METKDMPHGIVGSKFAQALIHGEFEKAHEMLSPTLRLNYSPSALKQSYDNMVEYAQPVGQPNVIVVNNFEGKGESGNGKQLDADGSTCVAIEGDGWCEAVTITAKQFGADYLISELDWGRP
jgi:hypothetical protein